MAKQQPEYSKGITTNTPLVLSYDKTKKDETDFRHDLVEFLIENGGLNLKCFVATTIYFETTKSSALKTWSDLLNTKFGETFHYHLAHIARTTTNEVLYIEYKKESLYNDFQTLVNSILEKRKTK